MIHLSLHGLAVASVRHATSPRMKINLFMICLGKWVVLVSVLHQSFIDFFFFFKSRDGAPKAERNGRKDRTSQLPECE